MRCTFKPHKDFRRKVLGIAPPSGIFLALGAMTLFGLMLPINLGPLNAIIQVAADPDMQGRVFTLFESAAWGISPISLAIAGPLADMMGTRSWFIIGGIVCILSSVVGFMTPVVMKIEEGRGGEESELERMTG